MVYKGSGRDERAVSVAEDLSEIFGNAHNGRPPLPSAGAVQSLAGKNRQARRQPSATVAAAISGLIVGALAMALPAHKGRQVATLVPTSPAAAPAELAGYAPPTPAEGRIAAASFTGSPDFLDDKPAGAKAASRPIQRTRAVYQQRKRWPRRSEVLAADMRLRRAYASAIRAGVDRGTLLEYRRRWARYRSREYDRPVRLIGAYADMTNDLHHLARQPERGSY
jgi:hypothetical protein